jgi:hypothetical protein
MKESSACAESVSKAALHRGSDCTFPMPDSIGRSLFTLANKIFRQGSYFEAALLYEACALHEPTFSPYVLNRNKALEALANYHPGRRPTLRGSTMSQADYLLRVYDTLLNWSDLLTDSQWQEILASAVDHPDYHLLCANYHGLDNSSSWLTHLNRYLKAHGLREASLRPFSTANRLLFNRLQFERGPTQHGELVSVGMSVYNAQDTLSYAIRSILEQDYQDLELIIINDKSSDDSASIAESFATADSRVRFINNAQNLGTYINRNRAIQLSKGRYFTVMDSDDFAHPQRLSIQVESLVSQQAAIAHVGQWVRATNEGRFLFKVGLGGAYLHRAVATLMFELEPVLSRIGYYDSVRMGADMEYYERMKKVFGPAAVTETEPPLAFALVHGRNLTSDQKHGICPIYGSSESRRAYRHSWKNWHESSTELFIGPSCIQRPFTVPEPLAVIAATDNCL